MTDFQIIRALLNQASAEGSKSTVLKPLGWLAGICVVGAVAAVRYNAPSWMLKFLCVVFAAVVLLYLVSFMICLFIDRDALRSEKYSIQKLAIERGIVGDSRVGVLSGNKVGPQALTDESAESVSGEKK